VAVQGDYAYVTDESFGILMIIDISDPANPQRMGEYRTHGLPSGVAVAGNFAYIPCLEMDRLYIVDISDPSNPQAVWSVLTPHTQYGVALSRDYAYIADGLGGLRIIDISEPTRAWETGVCELPGEALDVAISGEHVFVADRNNGLRIIDVSEAFNPQEVGFYDTPGLAFGIDAVGNLAFVADYYNLGIYDCSEAMGNRSEQFEPQPSSFIFSPAYPNPFNNRATVAFSMPRPGEARLSLFNPLGLRVKELTPSGWFPTGTHEFNINADSLPSGDYLLRLDAGEQVATQKVVLVR